MPLIPEVGQGGFAGPFVLLASPACRCSMPLSQRILTIGFDDTVRLWAPLEQPQAKLELSGACQHDTNTGW